MKRWLILIVAIIAIIAIIGGIKAMQFKTMMAGFASQPEPSATVSSVKIANADWNPTLSAIGSLRAVRGVDLAVESAGLVQSIRFASGQGVAQGTTLVELVNDADRARLVSLNTAKDLAEANFRRAEAQLKEDIISKAETDTARANRDAAVAAVKEQQAQIAKKTLRAPFAGRLGITTISPGQYLNPGDKVVTLQQLDPIHVDFTVPQSALSRLMVGQAVIASAENGVSLTGKVVAVEPVVDTGTRNVKVLATLPNPDGKLLPGMFVKVQASTGAPEQYLTLPATAVTFNPYGETVFVIVDGEVYAKEQADKAAAQAKAENRELPKADPNAPPPPPAVDDKGQRRRVAKQVFITTGAVRGDQVAIVKGLKQGDEVVTSGQLKLKNGLKVLVDNTVVPSNDQSPQPKDE